MPAVVTQAQDIGTYWLLTAEVGGGTEDGARRGCAPGTSAAPKAGDAVWLALVGAHTCFYRNDALVAEVGAVKTRQPEGLAADPAGGALRRLLGDPAADDGGELLGAGHHLARAARLRRHRVVQVGDARRRPARRAAAPDRVLALGAAGRDSARHRAGAVDAGQGLAGVGGAGAGRDLAADPVERGRHDLADLRPHRHRPARRRARQARHRLQLHRQRHATPGSPCC